MNPNAILALISDLYSQIGALTEENARLREHRADEKQDAPPPVR